VARACRWGRAPDRRCWVCEPRRAGKSSATVLCADAHGFSLHAGVRCGEHQRKELERLCRYITRPAIANERLKEDAAGNVVLQLKSPWRDGTTHLRMTPLEFMQRLLSVSYRMTVGTLNPSPRPSQRARVSMAQIRLHEFGRNQ
jgi:hypothetical protein